MEGGDATPRVLGGGNKDDAERESEAKSPKLAKAQLKLELEGNSTPAIGCPASEKLPHDIGAHPSLTPLPKGMPSLVIPILNQSLFRGMVYPKNCDGLEKWIEDSDPTRGKTYLGVNVACIPSIDEGWRYRWSWVYNHGHWHEIETGVDLQDEETPSMRHLSQQMIVVCRFTNERLKGNNAGPAPFNVPSRTIIEISCDKQVLVHLGHFMSHRQKEPTPD